MERRSRRWHYEENPACGAATCAHGGRCVGDACVCAGAWGGATCSVYVGYDHACSAACSSPALCVWGPDVSATEVGDTYCVCPPGATCGAPSAPPVLAAVDTGGGGAAWAGAVLALLVLGAAVLAALFLLHRRHRSFRHLRLSDNVEINNPMYLAGEEEERAHTHFHNPVYDTLYAPTTHPLHEEHANLLAEGEGEGSPRTAPPTQP